MAVGYVRCDFYTLFFSFGLIAIQKTLLNIVLSAGWPPSLAVTHTSVSITSLNVRFCLNFCCSQIDWGSIDCIQFSRKTKNSTENWNNVNIGRKKCVDKTAHGFSYILLSQLRYFVRFFFHAAHEYFYFNWRHHYYLKRISGKRAIMKCRRCTYKPTFDVSCSLIIILVFQWSGKCSVWFNLTIFSVICYFGVVCCVLVLVFFASISGIEFMASFAV